MGLLTRMALGTRLEEDHGDEARSCLGLGTNFFSHDPLYYNFRCRQFWCCMKSLQTSHFTDGTLPVFVFPNSLKFFGDDQSSHKQVLTVYNPYEFALRFKVLCTAPSSYVVVESDGIIKPRCCVDIVIRHTNAIPGVTRHDKFCLHIFKRGGVHKAIGKKEIQADLLPSQQDEQEKEVRRPPKRGRVHIVTETPQHAQGNSPSIWVILLALGSIGALMLPTQGDMGSAFVPLNLYLSVNQKLVAAFLLGLVIMAILKT